MRLIRRAFKALVEPQVILRWAVGMGSVFLAACGSASAPSRQPVGFSAARVYSDHREVDVVWKSAADDARLSGTVFLPLEAGPHAAMIFHFGSNRWTREPWGLLYSYFNAQGIAVLTYDKRGVGESEGNCCPFRDKGYFQLLAGDLIGATRAIRQLPDIDPDRIGLYGTSQGGWIVPLAAAEAPDELAVVALGSGPAVSVGEEILYSELTGDAMCTPSGRTDEEIEVALDAAGPSLFDPIPYLETMTLPGLWQFCQDDTSIPVDRSIRTLESIRDREDKDFTIQTFMNCNHQFVRGGKMCQGEGVRVNWWDPLFAWLRARGFSGD